MKRLLFFIFLFLSACAKPDPSRNELFIFAAASLTDALPEAVDAVRGLPPEVKITFNFAGSSILAHQIMSGAPAGVYISADPLWAEALARQGDVDSSRIRPFLKNRLVVIAPAGAQTQLDALRDLGSERIRFIAMGDFEHVPAGRYARQALERAGVWESVTGKIVTAQNVRAALAFVGAGEADAGIVYKTDALVSDKVKIVLDISDEFQPDIRSVIMPLNGSGRAAEQLIDALFSEAAESVFRKHGFGTPH